MAYGIAAMDYSYCEEYMRMALEEARADAREVPVGAVIVRGGRIVSATCYLPLTDRLDLGKELGTRHRAAVGISEVSDSVTIIVSEETGYVSVAKEGRLQKKVNEKELTDILESLLAEKNNGHNMDVLKKWKDRWKNGKTKN